MSDGIRKTPAKSDDKFMIKFLYSILSQQSLKDVNWANIAKEHNINSGHAARMRYCRFKDNMEGKAKPNRKGPTTPSKRGRSKGQPRTPGKGAIVPGSSRGANFDSEAGDAIMSEASPTPAHFHGANSPTPTNSPSIKRDPEDESELAIIAAAPLTPPSACPSPIQHSRQRKGESSARSDFFDPDPLNLNDPSEPDFHGLRADAPSFATADGFRHTERDSFAPLSSQDNFPTREDEFEGLINIHGSDDDESDADLQPAAGFKREIEEV